MIRANTYVRLIHISQTSSCFVRRQENFALPFSQITDDQGQLQYIPFMTCNETSRPLELYFGVEKGVSPHPPAPSFFRLWCGITIAQTALPLADERLTYSLPEINCTVPVLPDPLFHLLEFYIHNDAPLTCRIPTHPLTSAETLDSAGNAGQPASPADSYIPLIFALSGTLQLSHLHINTGLNVLLHTSPDLEGECCRTVPRSSISLAARTLPVLSGLIFTSRLFQLGLQPLKTDVKRALKS